MTKEYIMLNGSILKVTLGSFAVASLLLPVAALAVDGKPRVMKPCMQCHKADPADTIRGKLGSVSMKAETLKVDTGGGVWLVAFDDRTTLDGAEALNKIAPDSEVSVKFTSEDGALYANKVKVKKPAKIAPEKQIKVDALWSLVSKGNADGKFTLVDARPGKVYLEGHIPGALSIYDAEFDKNLDKLPKDKDNLLVFYCGGPT